MEGSPTDRSPNAQIRTLDDIVAAENLSIAATPDGTDKGRPKRYLEFVYQPLLEGRKDEEFSILEIGVRSGASMKLWHEFFDRGFVTGLDNASDVVKARPEWTSLPRTEYLLQDAYAEATLESVPGEFDLIIDDGPHSPESQRWAIVHWSSRLKPEGLLIVEDVQGGQRTSDMLVDSVPSAFRGCVRVVDLRSLTGQGDALLVILHNCTGICDLRLDAVDQRGQRAHVRRALVRPLYGLRTVAGSVAKALGLRHR